MSTAEQDQETTQRFTPPGRNAFSEKRRSHEQPWLERAARLEIPTPLGDAVDLYIDQLLLDCTYSTAYHYRRELHKLAFAHPDKGPGDFTKFDLSAFISRRGQGKAPRTVKKTTVVLRQFFGWLTEMEIITKNPALGVKTPKLRAIPPRYLSEEEIQKLLRLALSRDLGMAVFVGLGYYAAMRSGSINSLQWSDVDWEGRNITVRDAKGGQHYNVPIHDKLYKLLEAWADASKANDSGYVHAHVWRGEWRGYYPTGSYKAFKRLARDAGLSDDVAPHDLRRSAATHMHSHGNEILVISRVLGHADITTTARHYAFTSEDQLREATSSLDAL